MKYLIIGWNSEYGYYGDKEDSHESVFEGTEEGARLEAEAYHRANVRLDEWRILPNVVPHARYTFCKVEADNYWSESGQLDAFPGCPKQLWCRVRIEGEYKGKPFVYEDDENTFSQSIHLQGFDPSTLWWTDGNMGCDCNRLKFLPDEWLTPEQREDGPCGEEIKFFRIVPLNPELPTLDFTLED